MRQMGNPFQEWSRNFALLALAVAGVGVFFGVQLTLFNNLIVDRLGIEAHELGYVEALREVPGFLNVLFMALVIRFAPSRVASISLVVMGIGIVFYSYASTVYLLALFSLVWSLGFHCWIPLEQSMGLTYAPSAERGRWLGPSARRVVRRHLLPVGRPRVDRPDADGWRPGLRDRQYHQTAGRPMA